ncbi:MULTISPECIES: hypothetical protein [unclassified Corynebacterium]|uniref:hypothetical protein n=1 Tax=unclassified Corynebacterium TaxID=2624378 RepID=UPI001EF3F27A|nr:MULTISPECIES: hypothetical protein [unclassified Corynebacterium]MCG7258510.1 hypothetical protein [Corynebacterium sp. ACRQK]MCG7263055.1 hypothetical protein [Corynebacterium sp. ACRQL]
MAQNDGFREGEENFASILDVDRILDAIGRGEAIPETENFDSNDPAFADLVARREELYQDIPPAPDVSFLFAEDSGEESETEVAEAAGGAGNGSRLLRTSAKAAAAGGVSLTSMLIAGGVAAAIAVGGLGYAAYSSSQGAHVKRDTVAEREAVEAEGSNGLAESSASGQGGVLGEENVADKQGRSEKSDRKSNDERRQKEEGKSSKPATKSSKAPEATAVDEIPTTTILLGGTDTPEQPGPAMPMGAPSPTNPTETTSKTKKPNEPTATRQDQPTPTTGGPRNPEPLPVLTDYNSPRADNSGAEPAGGSS